MLTVTQFRSYGFRLDQGIQDAVLLRCIQEAEEWFAVRYFKTDNYLALLSMPADSPVISGGIYTNGAGEKFVLAGYLKAVAHIAYGALLRDNINATTFGSVRKRDEHSDNVDPWDNAKYHDTIGRGWLHDIAVAMGWSVGSTGSYFTETAKLM